MGLHLIYPDLVVERVVDASGRTVYQAEPEVVAEPISPATSRRMRRLSAGDASR